MNIEWNSKSGGRNKTQSCYVCMSTLMLFIVVRYVVQIMEHVLANLFRVVVHSSIEGVAGMSLALTPACVRALMRARGPFMSPYRI